MCKAEGCRKLAVDASVQYRVVQAGKYNSFSFTLLTIDFLDMVVVVKSYWAWLIVLFSNIYSEKTKQLDGFLQLASDTLASVVFVFDCFLGF